MKVQKVELKETYPGYGVGAKPGFKCSVTLQYGGHSHQSFEIELKPDAVREVMSLAAAKAMEQIALDTSSIDVGGSPGEPLPEPTPEPVAEAAANPEEPI